jgi:hypothetical protein
MHGMSKTSNGKVSGMLLNIDNILCLGMVGAINEALEDCWKLEQVDLKASTLKSPLHERPL